ncbi:MAG: hypothetical protein HY526_11685 [Betaproteobacteria bacterium]|nr:hypothetical protein [Betaproteobacteria bacterium]
MRLLSAVLWPVLALVALVSSAIAQQVTIERDSELRAEARHDAAVVATVKQGTTGEATAKSGAWVNVKTPDAAGWLFSFNVRFAGTASGQGGASDASALGRLVAPRQQLNVTSTIGIRGIEEEDLKQATFNAGQMKLLDQYAASKEAAQEGAAAAGLEPARVDYLGATSK